MSAEEAFALLAQEESIKHNINNLKEKLLDKGIWIWTKGAIEKHLDINGKNEAIWASLKEKIETLGLATALPDDHVEITNCVKWLLK